MKKLLSLQLHWQILIALVLAGIVGTLLSADSQLLGINALAFFEFIGKLLESSSSTL